MYIFLLRCGPEGWQQHDIIFPFMARRVLPDLLRATSFPFIEHSVPQAPIPRPRVVGTLIWSIIPEAMTNVRAVDGLPTPYKALGARHGD